MNRRQFLAGSGLTLVSSLSVTVSASERLSQSGSATDLIRPKALKQGDVVGLITPATYVPDPDRLATAERTLKYFGLRTKMGAHAGKRVGDYKASIDERLEDFHTMFRDPDVAAVFAIRGGYGSGQLLDRIDYDLVRRNPKIFLGYSDITAMHLAINRFSRLVTFHGPMMLAAFSGYTQEHFRKALFNTAPIGKVSNPPETNELRPGHALRTIRPGIATGPLIGGNLSLISATLGTPYELETRGRIFFIEDVDEEPYRVDRMLTQLRLAGKLDSAAGIVFGECPNCAPRDFKPSTDSIYSLGEVLDNILGGLKIPVLAGLTIGHTSDQLTLPMGVTATLDAVKGVIDITESAVV